MQTEQSLQIVAKSMLAILFNLELLQSHNFKHIPLSHIILHLSYMHNSQMVGGGGGIAPCPPPPPPPRSYAYDNCMHGRTIYAVCQ